MSDTESDTHGKVACYRQWHRSAVPDVLSSDTVDGKSLYSTLLVWEIYCTYYIRDSRAPAPLPDS